MTLAIRKKQSRERYKASIERRRARMLKPSARILARMFQEWSIRMQAELEALGSTSVLIIQEKDAEEALIAIHQNVGKDFAASTFRNMKGSDIDMIIKDARLEFDWEEELKAYLLANGGARIAGITSETRRVISKVLEQAIGEGLSVPETSKLIRSAFSEMSRSRAVRIARTELISASNHGVLVGADSTSIPYRKQWLAVVDSATRLSHVEANGQTVERHQPFIVQGEELQHPGDVSGSPDNIINCRCTVLPIVER